MDKTINAKDVQPGMTIAHETDGIKSIFTVDTVEREKSWVTLRTAERAAVCIRPDTQVTVEGDRPAPAYAVGTVLRVPGVGCVVKVSETDSAQWVNVETGATFAEFFLNVYQGVSVVYSPKTDNEVTEVPDVVKRWQDWERDNTEWRKHKWKDNDGDMWEWLEDVGKWRVEDSYGILRDLPGPSLFATFPVTRVQ